MHKWFCDFVRCCHCGRKLSHWRCEQDPWVEHAKYYPTCQFLLQEKGVNFIFCLVKQYPNVSHPDIYTKDSALVISITSVNDLGKKIESAPPPEEKNELQQRIHALEELYRCKICLNWRANIIFTTYEHLFTCSSCTLLLKECPLCRRLIENIYKTNVRL